MHWHPAHLLTAAAAAAFMALYRFTDASSLRAPCAGLVRASEILSSAFAVYFGCMQAQGRHMHSFLGACSSLKVCKERRQM